ncbi:MAG: thiosulfate oxidation carrier complex protein SoxZ [Thiohalorhabdus sp.]|uniref:thiosulfate oxidation carrier complex protein SoxZ n=1 Tax=Thiohalorhabdus sp. TaxID=3094134 RepID=UPI0039813CE1
MAKTGSARIRVGSAKKGESTQVRALILHPMETGQRKDDKTGETIPEHFIQKVKADLDGTRVFEADWSVAISKNPYMSFYIVPESSSTLKVTWEDNEGETFSAEAEVEVG